MVTSITQATPQNGFRHTRAVSLGPTLTLEPPSGEGPLSSSHGANIDEDMKRRFTPTKDIWKEFLPKHTHELQRVPRIKVWDEFRTYCRPGGYRCMEIEEASADELA